MEARTHVAGKQMSQRRMTTVSPIFSHHEQSGAADGALGRSERSPQDSSRGLAQTSGESLQKDAAGHGGDGSLVPRDAGHLEV